MPNTIFTQDIQEIKKFFRTHKKIVLKPIHGYSGNDIHLLSSLDLRFIKKFLNKHSYIMSKNI